MAATVKLSDNGWTALRELINKVDLPALVQRDGVQLKGNTRWLEGRCPGCGGRDRFTISPGDDGVRRWQCRGCHEEYGDALDYLMHFHHMTFEQGVQWMRGTAGLLGSVAHAPGELDRAPQEPEGRPPDERIVARCHEALLNHPVALDFLRQRYHLDDTAIDLYRLGYVEDHWGSKGPGILIPVEVDGKLMTGRVRSLDAAKQGWRYLPWSVNCGAWPWGVDSLSEGEEACIVEGEFKAMTVARLLPCVGLPGVDNFFPTHAAGLNGHRDSFEAEWLARFAKVRKVYVVLDGGQVGGQDALIKVRKDAVTHQRRESSRTWVPRLVEAGANVWLVRVVMKPDDLINTVGLDAFARALRGAEPARWALEGLELWRKPK